jgi:hypothetical protein
MPFFSDTIAAALGGSTVRASLLAFLDFAGDPRRVWGGFGVLKTTDSNEWSGLGEFGTVSGLDASIGTSASPMKLTLSGVDPDMVAKAANSAADVKGRTAAIYLQFFDPHWQPLDMPYALRTGAMDVMTHEATGADTRTITLAVEGRWTARRRPISGLYADRDQEARFPGDLGLVQVATLVNKAIRWPTF